jgi:hypothetical protein
VRGGLQSGSFFFLASDGLTCLGPFWLDGKLSRGPSVLFFLCVLGPSVSLSPGLPEDFLTNSPMHQQLQTLHHLLPPPLRRRGQSSLGPGPVRPRSARCSSLRVSPRPPPAGASSPARAAGLGR